ncbi:MAG: DNA polymerase [Gammaproteobacteria bacterium]|nr:DNA polymerase [Gammaproteobacteria bacterium]
MFRLVFDIEGDGFLRDVTRMWTIIIHNLTTGERVEFLENDLGWQDYFNNNVGIVVGHNILGYDVPVLEKLFGYKFPKETQFHDTLLMSQILDYRRFGYQGHSLAVWGKSLNYPKIDFHDFSKWTPEMSKYCHQDVNLNVEVYKILIQEYYDLFDKLEKDEGTGHRIKTFLQAEHAATTWQAQAELHGWPFDKEGAIELFGKLEEELTEIRDKLEGVLGSKSIAIDKVKGIVPHKEPKWVATGYYHAHTAQWFGIDPRCGSDLSTKEARMIIASGEYEEEDEIMKMAQAILTHGERPITGPYCRVDFQKLKLSSVADVKIYLYRHGWEPSEWNTKWNPATKKNENTSPKIIDDDLDLLGENGRLYRAFTTAESRYSIVKTWIENVDDNGMLHGNSRMIGTPSMRATHQIIVNVPSGELKDDGTPVSKWGPEMRALFRSKPGWKCIGCDSKGNQARGLAHYLGDQEFIDVILHGDIHAYNAVKLTEALSKMGVQHTVPRSAAKRILYAFLFGASGKKLWSYIFGTFNATKGNKLKKEFIKAVPGFEDLNKKLENIYGSTSKFGYGYIPSMVGNRIYVDSFHKLLVYLLQSLEKITCSTAVMLTMQRLEEESIPYIPLIYYHDEEDFMVPEEFAERAAEIGSGAFKDAALLYDIKIMDGDAKIGDSWLDIH